MLFTVAFLFLFYFSIFLIFWNLILNFKAKKYIFSVTNLGKIECKNILFNRIAIKFKTSILIFWYIISRYCFSQYILLPVYRYIDYYVRIQINKNILYYLPVMMHFDIHFTRNKIKTLKYKLILYHYNSLYIMCNNSNSIAYVFILCILIWCIYSLNMDWGCIFILLLYGVTATPRVRKLVVFAARFTLNLKL